MNPSKTNTSSSKNSTGSSSDQRTTSTRPNSESEYSCRSSSHLDVHDDMVELGGPGFVQIIHKYLVQHGEICIPKGFVREYGDEDDEDNGDSEGDGESEEIRADITRKGKISITPGGLETQERAIAVQRDFKSSNNYPFFTIGIQPSYVDHKYLPIPSYFEGKEELKELENIKLKVVPNYGRSWIVHLPTWGQAHGTRFSKGVSKFLKDNEVKVGDVCVFEMVTKKTARVHILRS
ncbi:hypothetical protein MKW94_005452 [Papaver nudicaule]|uniref:TF-B3 domain-containing protein n=1 Tax=Papaver nudicaule TaxID=74823 RepID=A0AA41SEX4_PAPNU|nr:hypothetical protein [Papaver nudicaule]